jgi:hypothetical protein
VMYTSKHSQKAHVKGKQRVRYAAVSSTASTSRRSSIDESDYERSERGLEAGLVEGENEKPRMSLPLDITLLAVIVVVCRSPTFTSGAES